jgi:Dcp1-like decapping family
MSIVSTKIKLSKKQKASVALLTLNVLRRQDDGITRVLMQSNYVSVYEFSRAKQQWEKKEIQGALYLVQRRSEPRHCIIILNKMSPTDLRVPIWRGTKVHLQDSILMLRAPKARRREEARRSGGRSSIDGVWFYDSADRDATFNAVSAILAASSSSSSSSSSFASSSASSSIVSISIVANDDDHDDDDDEGDGAVSPSSSSSSSSALAASLAAAVRQWLDAYVPLGQKHDAKQNIRLMLQQMADNPQLIEQVFIELKKQQ